GLDRLREPRLVARAVLEPAGRAGHALQARCVNDRLRTPHGWLLRRAVCLRRHDRFRRDIRCESFQRQLERSPERQLAAASSDLVLFSGPSGNPGTITLTVSALAESSITTGSAQMISSMSTACSARITVCYDYSPIIPFCLGDGTG